MPATEHPQEPLAAFTPAVRAWFERRFGRPTPPQTQGWAAIQRGEHTLILAPTGSGKTLAAFLWGIDQRCREQAKQPGVRILYISPLKALNNDVERNLRVPLGGIQATAKEMGIPLPEIRVAVRSGDTPQRERQGMVRRPPDILITTPESLYLLLTSSVARGMFRGVRTVIVDEIHTLAGTKRGVHLALSLEQLQHLAAGPVQRIGLSATIRPLQEAARFLGGNEWLAGGDGRPAVLAPRPVTIVDAHYHKPLDLLVTNPVPDLRHVPGDSVWPSIISEVADLIERHRTTLIFCNSRRLAERTADQLNVELAAREQRQAGSALIADGVARGLGMMAVGDGTQANPIRAHHGSVAREARLEMEQALKEGRLPALVATSSLELGIDIGAVDLVIQLHAPESPARGLQRVGRSGHLVGQTSKARVFPMHPEDVMAAAAIAGAMLRGEVEPTATPRNPLDVLAQQIVAMVSVETWDVEALYHVVRQAYAYQELPAAVYRTVLEMLAGNYPSQAHRELRARLAWDRVNDRLAALPGSKLQALSNGGTIPDQGSFTAYLSDGQTKLGELDEEFVFETRVGDTLMLGSQVWRVLEVDENRVRVTEAPGSIPRMPFWRGEAPWRPYEVGCRLGEFRRLVAERLLDAAGPEGLAMVPRGEGRPAGWDEAMAWLRHDFALDENCARHVLEYVARQLVAAGAISSDRTIVIETFRDALGEPRMVIHSPFGGRVNGPWGLAVAEALRERVGADVEVQSTDDGILFRYPFTEGFFAPDVVARMAPAEAHERVLRSLPDSPVFGTRFRQNAARSLLLPGLRGGKRTPLWLQRLRARDLLQVVRRFSDFPVMVETYRECLQDVMDLPHLEEVLAGIQEGSIRVVTMESAAPSPVAAALLLQLANVYVYEGDAPRAEGQLQQLAVDRALIGSLLRDAPMGRLLKPEAAEAVAGRLQHTAPGTQARTIEELAVFLEQAGDLSSEEIAARCAEDPAPWLAVLTAQGRILEIAVPTSAGEERRWVPAHYAEEYARAFAAGADPAAPPDPAQSAAAGAILCRFLGQAGPVTPDAIRRRYAFREEWLRQELARLVDAGQVERGQFTPGATAEEFLDTANLQEIHRRTLSLLRGEVRPVPRAVYADFLARWQHLAPAERLAGPDALLRALRQLRGVFLPGRLWERDVLPLRLERYSPADLDALCQAGEVVWAGASSGEGRRGRVGFALRGEGQLYLDAPAEPETLSAGARAVYDLLRSEGALFFTDIWAALDLEPAGVEQALLELAAAGLVTNDSADALRRILAGESSGVRPEGKERKPLSALEKQLAGRATPRPAGPRSGRTGYYAAKHRAAEKARAGATLRWPGRWSLVHRLGVLGRELPADEKGALQARFLLERWGILTFESLQAEDAGWSWALVAPQLSLMEMRGEVRRGYFVEGLPGLQYALPEAVEQLRACRDSANDRGAPLVLLNACDPANLYGPERDDAPETAAGGRLAFARLPTTWLVQHHGRPVLLAESTGASLLAMKGVEEGILRAAVDLLCRHLLRDERRIVVQAWNGGPVLGSEGASLLEAAGLYREPRGMVWERLVGTGL